MTLWEETFARPETLRRRLEEMDCSPEDMASLESVESVLTFHLFRAPEALRNILSREAAAAGVRTAWHRRGAGTDSGETLLLGTPKQLERVATSLAAVSDAEARTWGERLRRALAGRARRQWTLPLPRGRELRLGGRTLIMGILNLTEDSFFAESRVTGFSCVARALSMVEEGADILDLGAESTRPGAIPVSEEEETARLVPALRAIREHLPEAVLSVDTTKASVARACVAAGADLVNDISGLGFDPDLASAVGELGVPLVLMHIRGTPETMQDDPRYGNLAAEMNAYFEERLSKAEAAGIPRDRIILDPGIGFGKTTAHNMALLHHPEFFRSFGRPLLVGHSRKSSFGKILRLPRPENRLESTLAVTALCAWQGVEILRVHDVRENVRVVRTIEAVKTLGA